MKRPTETAARPLLLTLLLVLLPAPLGAQETPAGTPQEKAAELPARPEEIEFPPLDFEVPDRAAFRHELSNGVVVYMAPSRELPLVDLTFTFKGGSYLDQPGQEGLAGTLGAMMRKGGAGELDARALDERLDFLATQISTGASEYRITASVDTLSRNLDESLELLLDILRRPRLQADRLALHKSQVIEALKQRNDEADAILSREWSALVYGPDHFKGRQATKASIEAIDEEALRELHARVVHPGNLVIGVTGDFDEPEMLKKLEAALAGWEQGEVPPDPPAPTHEIGPGVYYIQKEIPQGKINLGLRGIQRDDPDYFALTVMSRILGSSGFTSRITRRVRSDEGLAYSAGAAMIPGLYFPGEFRAWVQSKSRTVALSIQLILEEMQKIASEPVSAEELEVAKQAMLESFPETFGSPATTVGVFVDDEITGRSHGYWKTWRERVRSVTAEDVLRVAKEHLDSKQVAILVVGDWEDVAGGDLEGRASMKAFFEGQATELPLRDPLTLEPLGR